MEDKLHKIFEELWDKGNISKEEFDAIQSLIDNDTIDLSRRWNILEEMKK